MLANSIFPAVEDENSRFLPLRRKEDSGEHRTATSPPFEERKVHETLYPPHITMSAHPLGFPAVESISGG